MKHILTLIILISPMAGFCQQVEALWVNGDPVTKKSEWQLYPGEVSHLRFQLTSNLSPADLGQLVLYINEVPLAGTEFYLEDEFVSTYVNLNESYGEDALASWQNLYKVIGTKAKGGSLHGTKVSIGKKGQPLHSVVRLKLHLRKQFSWIIPLAALLILAALGWWLFTHKEILRDTLPEGQTLPEKTEKRKYSLSKVQFAIWNLIVAFSAIYIFSITWSFLPFTAQVLGFLGISGAQLTVGLLAMQTRNRSSENENSDGNSNPVKQREYKSNGFFKDILSNEKGVSLQRFQNVLWSVFIWVYFLYEVIFGLYYPEIQGDLVTLAAFSVGLYGYSAMQEQKASLKNESKESKPPEG